MNRKAIFNVDEEELLKQEKQFISQKCMPAAKLLKAEKRKNNCAETTKGQDESKNEDSTRQKSKFSTSRKAIKKKKDDLADFTVLQEAVSKEESKTVVLGTIVERNVPYVSQFLSKWSPVPSPLGFPRAEKLQIQEKVNVNLNKSLFMQQFDKSSEIKREIIPEKHECLEIDKKLLELGNKSFVVDGKSSLGISHEASKIHQENISILASLSHERRIEERNEIMSLISPEQLQFIKSLRTKKIESSSVVEESMDTLPILSKTTDTSDSKKLSSDVDQAKRVKFSSDTDMIYSVEENEKLISELPISPNDSRLWVHMNKVELDKLRWTTDVPPPKALKNNEGFVARFNFEGDLLPYDSEISWREGLHHHGNEPSRPGYTMDELFIFVRSKVNQQRHIGLKTLANILRNAKEGLYDSCFDSPIIQLMVDAGLVLLLRFAIDENSAQIYQEALRALYFLIFSEPDEKCLDLVESWVPHDAQPCVSSLIHSKEKDRKELDEEEKELKDVEVIELDIIRALVRMDVHLRLRYFLESVNLSPPDAIYILGILKRMSRHSLTAAWTIASTPRLLSATENNFLTHNFIAGSNVDKIKSVYGVPLRFAISFFKVLATQSRTIASNLINNYDIMSRILTYVSAESNQISMPETEVLALIIEAYSFWAILLKYGLAKAQHSFSAFYPLLIKQLIFYRDKIDIDDKIEENQYNYDVGSQLIYVANKALCVAATKFLLVRRMKNKEASILTEDGRDEVVPPPSLDWEEFGQILSLVENCLQKWMTQLLKNLKTTFSILKLLGCFFNFLTTYFGKWSAQYSFEGVTVIKEVEKVYTTILHRFFVSDTLGRLLLCLNSHSILISKLQSGSIRDPKNLGSVACVCYEGKVVAILQKESPFPMLLPILSFLKTLLTIHPNLEQTSFFNILNSKEIENYFSSICLSQQSLKTNWLSRVEIFTVVNILEIASIKGCDNPGLYHKTAVSILPSVHKGDEHLIKTLLSCIICNPDFIKDISDVESQINIMSVKDYNPLKSPAIQQPIISALELTQRAVKSLHSIGQDLVQNLLHSKALEGSLVRHNSIPFLTNTLSRQIEEFPLLLDSYWPLSPLKLMNLIADKQKVGSDQTSPERILSVTRWLQMTYLLLKYRTGNGNCNPTGWMRHLSTAFLASSDLFLDVQISSYIQSCLAAILENGNSRNLDCTLTFPGLSLSYDWYKDMVVQYGSVSYGDSTFALFVLIPLQRYWPETYRTFLFGEQSEVLPFIRLTIEEVMQFIPITQFLEPPEENENVILKYKSALGSGHITKQRNPFLYKLTTHHVVAHSRSVIKTT